MMAMPKEKQDDIIAIDHREDVDDDIKAEVLHKEYQDAAAAEDVVQKSPFEELSFFKTISIFRKATFFALLAAFSAAADGYQIAITGNVISNAGFIAQYGSVISPKTGKLALAAKHLSVWGGVQSACQGTAMLTLHLVADRFGRKKGFYVIWVALAAGIAAESFGRTWKTWLVAKMFSGFAVGGVQFLTGSYLTDISPPRTRGFLLLFYSVWYGLGQLCATTALKVMKDKNPMIYLPLIYSEWAMLGIMAFIYAYIPESPYWLAGRGYHDRGRAVIERLNGRIKNYDVDFHYGLLRQTVDLEQKHNRELTGGEETFWQTVKNTKEIFIGVNLRRTLIAFMPAAVQQLTGLAVLSSYSSYFAQMANFADPFVFTLLLAIVSIGITLVGAVVIDYFGRRTLFIWSACITWITLILIGTLGVAIKNMPSSVEKLVVFLSMVWRMASTILGDLGWSTIAEVGSTRLRSKTAGFAACGGVLFGLLFNSTTPYMLSQDAANWGLKTAFFFAGVSAPLVIASFFIVPDTSRRTPAELDEMFEKKIKAWRFREYVTDAQKALYAEQERNGERPVAERRDVA